MIPSEVLDRFGVRLVSVDRPGYGNTDPLAGDRPGRVHDIIAVCDALEIGRFPVMGASAGGSNVLTLAAAAPDRVARVVLVSGQMPYDDEEAIAALQPGQAGELPACVRDGPAIWKRAANVSERRCWPTRSRPSRARRPRSV